MKQGQIVAVFNILKRFQDDIQLPNDISYAFFRLMQLVKDQVDFQVKRQNKLAEKYHCHEGENGLPVCENDDDARGYSEELNELIDMDVDLGEYKKIPFKNDGRCNLSPRELMILSDFFEYV